MEEIISGNCCRLCMWKTSKLIPILGSNNLVEKIGQLMPIEIHPGNGLSQLICGDCLYKVELFSEFRISAMKCDLIQQDYKRLWQKQALLERNGLFSSEKSHRTLRVMDDLKPESQNSEALQTTTVRQPEPVKVIEEETWPSDMDQDEVKTTKEVQLSTSLYARTPCTGAPGCPYICRYCKKEFSLSNALSTHEKKHADNVCLLCDEKFDGGESLRLHLRKDCYPTKVPEEEYETEEGNFECNICKRIFRSSIALWRHCVSLKHSQKRLGDKPKELKDGNNSWQLKRTVGRPKGSGSIRGGLHNKGRGGRKMMFKARTWVYEKTPCDVCGKVFTSSHGMLIHRKHIHK